MGRRQAQRGSNLPSTALPCLHLRDLVLVRPPRHRSSRRPCPCKRLVPASIAARPRPHRYVCMHLISQALHLHPKEKNQIIDQNTNRTPRSRNLQHLDRRLATHHPVPPASDLQQRRAATCLLRRPEDRRSNPAGSQTIRETRDSGDDVPPRDDGVWRVHALGAAEPSHEGDGHWRLWECGVDGFGGCGVGLGGGG